MGVADYSKRRFKHCEVPHLKSSDPNRIQVTTLTCCNIQAKQCYCTMLATATGNCDVTNVTYNENKYYVVTWIVYLESFMYLRQRQWLRHMVVVCHITEVIDLPNMVLMKHWAHCKSMTQPPPPNPPVPAAGHRWMFFADSCITFALFEWVAMMGRGTKMVENHRIEINGKKRWICEERTRGRKELTPENLLRTNFSTVHYFFYVGLSSHGEWRSWGRSATTFCTKAKSKR